jgi:hypothetical protein
MHRYPTYAIHLACRHTNLYSIFSLMLKGTVERDFFASIFSWIYYIKGPNFKAKKKEFDFFVFVLCSIVNADASVRI